MQADDYERIRIGFQAAMNTPVHEYFRENGVYAYSTLIPETHNWAKRVHFVSGSNGDEFGQFPSQSQALQMALRMAKLSEAERRHFDQ